MSNVSIDTAELGKQKLKQVAAEAAAAHNATTNRVTALLASLKTLLKEKYAFDVFAPNSINFGILVTYRQKWEPQNYQVGDLVSTIPLAPREIRRYTTRMVNKRTRAAKEVDDSLQIRKNESVDTSRADSEIVRKAAEKTNFNITAHESIGSSQAPYQVDSTQSADRDQSKESAQVKKDFRESVLKSAQEYKQQHRMEIDTTQSDESETTTFHEIQNPNDELSVTYLFYELQRTYKISEKIQEVTPVILVANDVPAPNQINHAWLLKNAWILNRVILDDSFRPTLEYLSKDMVGAEINLRVLVGNAAVQKRLVEQIGQQLKVENKLLTDGQADVRKAVDQHAKMQQQDGIFQSIKKLVDPAGLITNTDTSSSDAAQSILDYSKDTLDRAEKEAARLRSELGIAVTALQTAIDKLAAAVKDRFDKVTEIDRLRLHVKDNILYYMQAIWNHEPPDQRFFRLYNLDVPDLTLSNVTTAAEVYEAESAIYKIEQDLANALGDLMGMGSYEIPLPPPTAPVATKKLVEVADISTLLGYKGNYMIFPLKENNYLTLHMMQDYLDVSNDVAVRDPDPLASYTLDELQQLASCLYKRDPTTFAKYRNKINQLIIDRLTSTLPDDDLVVVPTTSLYIEALLGTHPLLEDFKLLHRALDVKKVQSEVRHAELENVRLAARVLKGKDSDPDVDKKIIIKGAPVSVTVPPEGG